MKTITKLWLLIAMLAVLTPIGLLLPAYFRAGRAWGEWNPNELKDMAGYVPRGLARLSSIWHAPIHDYALLSNPPVSYILSALVGILAVTGVVYMVGKFFAGKQ